MVDGFDGVMAAGRAAVLDGTHRVEVVPETGGRWGLSVVLLPSGHLAGELRRLTDEALEVCGAEHWPSGGNGRAHVTIRALERHGDDIGDDQLARYRNATARALGTAGPVRLDFRGIVVSVGGVMACATTPDGSADRVRAALARELGADGWLEDTAFERGRDAIWYCSLVHFAGPVRDAEGVLAWVEARRHVPIGDEQIDAASLCRWAFDGHAMAPVMVGDPLGPRLAPDQLAPGESPATIPPRWDR